MQSGFTRLVGALAAAIVALLASVAFGNARTLVANTQQEFNLALQSANSGDVIELSGASSYELLIARRNYSPPITIRSQSANAAITRIAVSDSSGINFTDLLVRPSGSIEGKKQPVLLIIKSRDICLSNSTAAGSAKVYLTDAEKNTENGENFALVRWSDGVVIENNVISGFMHGIGVLETSRLTINHNEITKIQGDGIRMGGVRDVEISDNRIHDFLGSDQSVNHSDMIQLWSTNAQILSSNITIKRNRLLSGNGPATQSVFLGNEQAARAPSRLDLYYSNIVISNNLIHNGHLHGITIGETDGLTILNNTLLPNRASLMGEGENRKMYPPMIRVAKTSLHVVIVNNVTSDVYAPMVDAIRQNYVYPKEDLLQDSVLSKLYSSNTFAGALPDHAFEARREGQIYLKGLGSSLTLPAGTVHKRDNQNCSNTNMAQNAKSDVCP